MIKHFLLPIIILSISCSSLMAQWNIKDVGARLDITMEGSFVQRTNALSEQYPQSNILAQDLSEFSNRYWNIQSSSQQGVFIGLHNRDKPHIIWRIGLHFGNNSINLGQLERKATTTIDTLRSNQSPQEVYIDSINRRHIGIHHQHQMIGVSSDFLFYLKPENRWSLYAGMGFSMGVLFNNNLLINDFETSYLEYRTSYQWHKEAHQFRYNMRDQETFSNDQLGYFGSAAIPLGVDFTLSKNPSSFWNNFHLFYEWRPTMFIRDLPMADQQINFTFVSALGARVQW